MESDPLSTPHGDDILKEGDVFPTVEDAKKAVKAYGAAVFTSFRVDTNNKLVLKFTCKHGGRKKEKKCTGERIKQHYNHLGCNVSINFYKSQKDGGSLSCTKIIRDHNHLVSQQIYDFENVNLNADEMGLCANLKLGNCKPSQIKRVLLAKYNKKLQFRNSKTFLRTSL